MASELALQRQKAHKEVKQLLIAESYAEAIHDIRDIIDRLGPHIGLRCDLMFCYLAVGDVGSFQRALETTLQEWEQLKTHLAPESRIRSAIAMAKFLESQAQVAEALHLLESCYESFVGESVEYPAHNLLSAQLLRLGSEFSSSRLPMALIYSRLQQYQNSIQTADHAFEVQHGMMFYEAYEIGPRLAWRRLSRNIEASRFLGPMDLSFFWHEVLGVFIEKDLPAPERPAREEGMVSNAYEDLLERLAKADLDWFSWIDSYSSSALNPGEQLRLLGLAQLKNPQDPYRQELKGLFRKLTSCLSGASSRLWIKKFESFQSSSVLQLVLDEEQKRLVCEGQELDLRRKFRVRELLGHLCQATEVSIEELCQSYGRATLDESYFNRFRIQVHRANESLASLTGREKSLLIDQKSLRLAPGIKLICKS